MKLAEKKQNGNFPNDIPILVVSKTNPNDFKQISEALKNLKGK